MDDAGNEAALRLNADQVAEQAQQLDTGQMPESVGTAPEAAGTDNPSTRSIPVDPMTAEEGDEIPSADASTEGYKPLASEIIEEAKKVYPPDVDPTVHLGVTPEEYGTLRDEYRRG